MATSEQSNTSHSVIQDAPDDRFAANDVRLSPRGWLLASVLIVLAFWLIPLAWQKIEPLDLEADYRIPYRLGNDYWNYRRTSHELCRGDNTVLVGDSVIWGHYVDSHETLSHYLNAGDEHHFVNLGVDGIHPVALAGLVEYYGDAIRNKRVILNCNLLWMSSPRHDLTSDKETPFNHPALAPQFTVNIPCYRATLSERLGIVVGRHFRFLGWADHVRIAYFGSDDLATRSFEHPYENPLDQVTLSLPSPDEPPSPKPDARAWDEKGLRKVNPEWVPLESSLQWRFFRQTVQRLRQRGNRVLVMIGPLNEHMFTADGLAVYQERKVAATAWHKEQGIPCVTAEVLPSRTYADLSHPNAEGYAILAEQLKKESEFRKFLDGD